MAEKDKDPQPAEPRGFGERTRGLAGEYAHELGWGLDEEERKKTAPGPQDTSGGADYDYGARDFGDEPVNMERVDETQTEQGGSMANQQAQQEHESAKKHGDKLDGALKHMDGDGSGAGLEPVQRPDVDEGKHATSSVEAPSGPPADKERVGRQQR